MKQLYDYIANWISLMQSNDHLHENERIKTERRQILTDFCACIIQLDYWKTRAENLEYAVKSPLVNDSVERLCAACAVCVHRYEPKNNFCEEGCGEAYVNWQFDEKLFNANREKDMVNSDNLTESLAIDVRLYVEKMLPDYHSSMPEKFYADIIADVMETSDYENGYYNNADISLGYQRVTAVQLGVEI